MLAPFRPLRQLHPRVTRWRGTLNSSLRPLAVPAQSPVLTRQPSALRHPLATPTSFLSFSSSLHPRSCPPSLSLFFPPACSPDLDLARAGSVEVAIVLLSFLRRPRSLLEDPNYGNVLHARKPETVRSAESPFNVSATLSRGCNMRECRSISLSRNVSSSLLLRSLTRISTKQARLCGSRRSIILFRSSGLRSARSRAATRCLPQRSERCNVGNGLKLPARGFACRVAKCNGV